MIKDLNYFKKKLLAVLDEKEKSEKGISKSLGIVDFIQQMGATMGSIEKGAGLPIGTKKEWPNGSGKWYLKTGNGWIRTYNNSNSRGAKMSIAICRRKIKEAKTLDELLALVQQNKDKFSDDNGNRLDVVNELMAEVHNKHQEFKGKTPAAVTLAKEPVKEETKEPEKETAKEPEKPKRKYDRPMDQKILDSYKDEASGMYSRTTNYGKKLKDGKAAFEKFINDKKDLIETNKKEIEAGKDPEGKFEEYNRYYEKQIEVYQKELDYINEKIKAKQDKREANKKAKEEAKKGPSDNEEKVSFAKNLSGEIYQGYNTDPSRFAVYAIDGKFSGLAVTQELADIINSHKEPDVSDWERAVATEINQKYPKIDKNYVENAITSIRMGFRNGKKTKVMIVPEPENYEAGVKAANENKEGILNGSITMDSLKEMHKQAVENGHESQEYANGVLETAQKILDEKPKESEQEKHDNRSQAMMGNQNAYKGGPKEEPKTEKNAAVDPEQAKKDAKKWHEVFDYFMNDYNNGVGHWFSYASRKGQDQHSKAFGRAEGFKNLIKMRETLKNDYGLDTPEIPKELMDKYNAYLEARKGVPGYSSAGNDILSGIRSNKIDEAFEAILKPIRDKYKEATENMQTEKISDVVTPVPNLSNEEHSQLFELKEDPNATSSEYNQRLYYNGKPFGDNGDYAKWSNVLQDQIDLVKNAGMDPVNQFNYLNKDITDRREYFIGSKSTYKSALNKFGEKKLKELMKPSVSDEEFEKKMLEKMAEKTRSATWIAKQIKSHLSNKLTEEAATELYNEKYGEGGATEALNAVDIPIDPEVMDEAQGLCEAKCRIITHPQAPSYSKTNKRAELKAMIENRIRNNPALARAMLVYIKNFQQETGKTVFTPANEIWQQLVKLNKNAMDSLMSGESETKGGSSGELYTGDGVTSVIENKDAGRYQITFDGKPDYETRSILKQNGFRWAPSSGTWQCYNTAHGQRSLEYVAEKLGWKKA